MYFCKLQFYIILYSVYNFSNIDTSRYIGVYKCCHADCMKHYLNERLTAIENFNTITFKCINCNRDILVSRVLEEKYDIFYEGFDCISKSKYLEICSIIADNQKSLRDNSYHTYKNLDNIYLGGVKYPDLIKKYKVNINYQTFDNIVPSAIPILFVNDPVAIFLTINSRGNISTSLTSCSRIFNLLIK